MSETKSIWYSVPTHCEESRYEFKVSRYAVSRIMDDGDAIAEECADDYYSNHDGWESSWPLENARTLRAESAVIAKLISRVVTRENLVRGK